MLKNLIGNALGGEGKELLQGLNLSPDKQEQALDLAKDSVMDGIGKTVKSGGIGDITKAFSSGGSSSLVQSITSNYGASLVSKLGLSESMSKTVSAAIIPMVFNYINKKGDVPTDSDDGIKNLLGDMGGNGIKGKLSGLIKNKF